MAISDEQYNNLLRRVEFIEATINNLISALPKLSSLDQLRQLVNMRQADVVDLKQRMVAVENMLDVLASYHKT